MTHAQDLAALLEHLRPQSAAALAHAIAVAAIDGVGGTLIIKFPSKGDEIDVTFVTGRARLELDV